MIDEQVTCGLLINYPAKPKGLLTVKIHRQGSQPETYLS